MVAEEVPERPLVVVVSLAGGDVDLGWRLECSSGWVCFVVAVWRCCYYYRCPAMVETEAREGALAVTVALVDSGPSVPAEQ